MGARSSPRGGGPEDEVPRVVPAVVRVGVYCRYSSHQQDEGYSIEAQHAAYEREAKLHPEWVGTFYDEPARSAYAEDTRKRARFRDLLADARAGTLDLVVVH